MKKGSLTEFRETGLLTFVNVFLQIFGWSLVYEEHPDGQDNGYLYPVRWPNAKIGKADLYNAYEKINEHVFVKDATITPKQVRAVAGLHLHPCDGCVHRECCDGICSYEPSGDFVEAVNRRIRGNNGQKTND